MARGVARVGDGPRQTARNDQVLVGDGIHGMLTQELTGHQGVLALDEG